jgi:excinuclease UvrABC ATPase subunit
MRKRFLILLLFSERLKYTHAFSSPKALRANGYLIKAARENNLKSVDVDIGDGLTVVTGLSDSGKNSLIIDT